ncbi:unnamed protein product, partial [Rotaria sp. Silwood2]
MATAPRDTAFIAKSSLPNA